MSIRRVLSACVLAAMLFVPGVAGRTGPIQVGTSFSAPHPTMPGPAAPGAPQAAGGPGGFAGFGRGGTAGAIMQAVQAVCTPVSLGRTLARLRIEISDEQGRPTADARLSTFTREIREA